MLRMLFNNSHNIMCPLKELSNIYRAFFTTHIPTKNDCLILAIKIE